MCIKKIAELYAEFQDRRRYSNNLSVWCDRAAIYIANIWIKIGVISLIGFALFICFS